MASKIFRSTLVVAVAILLCSLGVVMGVLYAHFSTVQVNQLKDQLSLAVTGTEQYGDAFLKNVEGDRFRLTWIAADGTVLFDTQIDASAMENHADREEVRQALQTGTGSATRMSATLTAQTLYEARKLQDGTVLRMSISRASVWYLVLGMIYPILIIVLLAVILSALLARRAAKKIVEPLNQLDLEHPLGNEVYEEITPLLHRINQQHIQINAQMETLRRKADEFEQITVNLQEGLVLLDKEGRVLSINPMASRLFGVTEDCIGRHFLQIDQSRKMRDLLNAALDQGRGTARAEYNGRSYHFEFNRIESNGETIGVVALMFDITDNLNAERVRREFTANVSHELKTPLQSIIGGVELMENGLVQPEDMPRFLGRIRKEATRLVDLIGDIIRLSQLDEDAEFPTERVDLLTLANEVQETLSASANEKQVSVEVSGVHWSMQGVRRLLYEILYNLCDNAIRYNVQGGRVEITVQEGKVTVADTGIGIPKAHQSRVYERFYRVDKSHSRQSGGTGLGLSIVKHAAAYHHANLHLESEEGKGTTITITF